MRFRAFLAAVVLSTTAFAAEPPKTLVQELNKPAPPPANVVRPEMPRVEPPPPLLDPPKLSEEEKASKSFEQTGQAPTLTKSDAVKFPFGESQPSLACAPLRACDIELQAGEEILAVALGDTERWNASPLTSGSPSAPTPHVIVKPQDYDLTTNLVIGTTRRTYHLLLTSPSQQEAASPRFAYIRRVTFYFPAEMVQQWTAAKATAARKEQQVAKDTIAPLATADLSKLHFNYAVNHDGDSPWRPHEIFDDGERMFLRFDSSVQRREMPIVLLEDAKKNPVVYNYRLRPSENDTWLVIDGLPQRICLVSSVRRGFSRDAVKTCITAGARS